MSIPSKFMNWGLPRCWKPAADVYRAPQGWIVKLEVAGIHPRDVTVQVQGNTLTIRGRRVDRHLTQGATCHQLEIEYREFERHLEFPVDLTKAHFETDYRDGMLFVRLSVEGSQP